MPILVVLAATVLLTAWSPRAADAANPASRAQEATARAAATGLVQVVLVRHAEKLAEPGPDPGLSPAGEQRAQALAALFGPNDAPRFFASQFRRTQDTLRPWAEAAGAEVEVHDARDPAGLVERLRVLAPGTLAVVAGHSNTVPDLVRRLGGRVEGLDERGFLPDDEYGRLFVVALPVGPDAADGPAPVTLELAF